MIFVTVGTQLPFDRLIRAVDKWAKDNANNRVFAQTARLDEENHVPRFLDCAPSLAPDAFADHCREARCIVAHAGTGSLIAAMQYGKPILIMPRRADLGEHRNDHQLATAKYFGGRSGVYVAYAEENVGPMLDRILREKCEVSTLIRYADDVLIEAVRSVIFAEDR
jgi:UDP-N-acetylglucosamine transferase subunit ALG13